VYGAEVNPQFCDDLTRQFHDHYRDPGPPRVTWLGVEALKCPLDLWIYQELITQLKPAVVIEGGTCAGGSALFMATVMDALGAGEVITMDFDGDENRPKHSRITYVLGDTLKFETFQKVANLVGDKRPRMLILDDGHSHEHVAAELDIYHGLLEPGDILIVEDTDLGGPFWGLQAFFDKHPEREWVKLTEAEKLKLTFNPQGYWRCIK
jgi:cephalosporin hydroxylase